MNPATIRTPHITPLSSAFLNHYLAQTGGGKDYPVFRGSAQQYGGGIGDILRTIGRFLLPIATSAARSFISSAAGGLAEGKSIKSAARGALAPTINSVGTNLTESLARKASGQSGSGRRRRRRPSKKRRVFKGRKASKINRSKYLKNLFGGGRKRRAKRAGRSKKIKRVRVLLHEPTNF